MNAELMQDALRDAIRRLRCGRWTALTIVITLALGTGLNAAVLALVYGILFRPLPFRDADRLVQIDEEIALNRLEAWAGRLPAVAAAGAFATAPHVLRGIGPPHVVKAAFVSDNFLDVLGLSPAPPAGPAGGTAAYGVFVSERTARAANVAPHALVGRAISIAGLSLPVAAVLPASVGFPADGTELWIPAAAAPSVTLKGGEDARRFRIVARMKAGASVAVVAAEATAARNELASISPQQKRQPVQVRMLQDVLYGSTRPLLAGFLAAAALVLIVACANVSTLLLGQSAAREQEFAIRLALGAGRGRVVASLFAESLLLAVAGSALGIGLALAATRALRSTAASGLPRLDAVAVDWHVLALSLLVSLLVALACTVGPALFTARTGATALVRAHGVQGTRGRGRMTNGLVIAQIALSTTLLVAAGLLGRSVLRLVAVDIGVDTRQSVAMRLMLADTMRLVPERSPFVAALLDRVRALPGVQQAGIGSSLPPDQGQVQMGIRLVDGTRESSTYMQLVAASPGFLEALGARLVAGRTLDQRDLQGNTPTVVISRSVARALFSGRDAVGQDMPARGLGDNPRPPRVIGIVEDVHYSGLGTAADNAVYMPWQQLPLGVVSLVVRTAGDPRQIGPGVRGLLEQMDANLAIESARTLDSLAGLSITERRLQIATAAAFALLTLILALLGLVSALMRSVTERRLELAIRAAIGGTPSQIRRLILVRGGRLSALGLACGVAGSLVTTRLLAHALFGVTPYDPLTFASVSAGILGTAVLACVIPARRAAGVNPATLLRSS